MSTEKTASNARWLASIAAVACALAAGGAVAKDHNVTVALHVSTEGLDLSQSAGAHTFYTRLENAAWVACTRGNRADLVPVDNPRRCYEDALGSAIRAAKQPLLTQIWLGTHTLQEAAVQGIDTRMLAASGSGH